MRLELSGCWWVVTPLPEEGTIRRSRRWDHQAVSLLGDFGKPPLGAQFAHVSKDREGANLPPESSPPPPPPFQAPRWPVSCPRLGSPGCSPR